VARRVRPSIWLADQRAEEVTWACDNYFPRKAVTSVYAPRNAGKTQVVIRIAADLSRGHFLGDPHPVRRTLINTREDDVASVIKPRSMAAGADLRNVAATSFAWEMPRDLGRLRALLEQARGAGTPFDIVVLDSIQVHIPVTHQGLAKDSMLGLVRLAREFDLAVVLIGHLNKTRAAGNVAAAMQGLQVLQAESKAIFVLGRNPDDPETIVLTCNRLGIAAQPPNLIFALKQHTLPGFGRPQAALEFVACDTTLTSDDVYRASMAAALSAGRPPVVTVCSWWIRAAVAEAGGLIVEDDLRELAIEEGAFSRPTTWDKALRKAGAVSRDGMVSIGQQDDDN
jgi:AAA domain